MRRYHEGEASLRRRSHQALRRSIQNKIKCSICSEKNILLFEEQEVEDKRKEDFVARKKILLQEKKIQSVLLLLSEGFPVPGRWCSWSSFGGRGFLSAGLSLVLAWAPVCCPWSVVSWFMPLVSGLVVYFVCVGLDPCVFFTTSSRGGLCTYRLIPSLGPIRCIIPVYYFVCDFNWKECPYTSVRGHYCVLS